MIHEKIRRTRRAQRARQTIRTLGDRPRLSVHISGKHIYAQIFSSDGSQVLAAASTLNKVLAAKLAKQNVSKDSANMVGLEIAKIAMERGISKVAFDRGGRKYHGRIAALADAAREGGLDF